jgi:ribosomal protein S18
MKRNHLATERRHCPFCRGTIPFDPDNIELLHHELDSHGYQRPAEQTGHCPKHQAAVAKAIKAAHKAGTLPLPKPLIGQRKHRPVAPILSEEDS